MSRLDAIDGIDMAAGRKRSFDKDEALVKAMRVFWANGFTGTSMSDLTAELEINKPSLYAAFGNKEELYAQSLTHYLQHYRDSAMEALKYPAEAPLQQRLRQFLYAIVDVITNPDNPNGCLFVKSCSEMSEVLPASVNELLQAMGLDYERTLSAIFEGEQSSGQLAKGADIELIVGYLMTLLSGLSVQAKGGKSAASLRDVADVAVDTLPGLA